MSMTYECKKCGHIWEGRKVNPFSCPRCKRYDWKDNIPEVAIKKDQRPSDVKEKHEHNSSSHNNQTNKMEEINSNGNKRNSGNDIRKQ